MSTKDNNEIKSQYFNYWNKDSKFLNQLLNYVDDITSTNSVHFIPAEDRIAVFDMDGTILTEQAPANFLFSLFTHRVNNDPTYECSNPKILDTCNKIVKNEKNNETLLAYFETYVLYLTEVFKGLNDEEYLKWINCFINTESPHYGTEFKNLYFEPMRELISYLQHNEFTCIIDTGNDEMVAYAIFSDLLNIPKEHCVGTNYRNIQIEKPTLKKIYEHLFKFELKEVFELLGEDFTINEHKVTAMKRAIDKPPVMAFGNGLVDLQMLDYSNESGYKTMKAMVLQDDIKSQVGLDLKEATKVKKLSKAKGYNTISVKDDFKTLFKDGIKPKTQ